MFRSSESVLCGTTCYCDDSVSSFVVCFYQLCTSGGWNFCPLFTEKLLLLCQNGYSVSVDISFQVSPQSHPPIPDLSAVFLGLFVAFGLVIYSINLWSCGATVAQGLSCNGMVASSIPCYICFSRCVLGLHLHCVLLVVSVPDGTDWMAALLLLVFPRAADLQCIAPQSACDWMDEWLIVV